MAGYYNTSMQELDDTYRLLPREILEDIGIMDPPEQQLHDVIEDLAARLVAVLGGTGTPKTKPVNNASRGGLGEREILAGRGNNAPRTVAAPPPFSPAPAMVRRRAGTGVFLPRNEGNSKNFGFPHRRGRQQQPAMVMVKMPPQQEMQPMAGGMDSYSPGVLAEP